MLLAHAYYPNVWLRTRVKQRGTGTGLPGYLHMEKRRLEQFKKRLETRQQELRRLVSRNVQDGRAADEQAAQDIADKAANSYTKEFLFHQSHNDRQLLQLVEEALERIREGGYGECVNCGNELNAKRLEAIPWTRYCIDCQEKVEQGLLEESSI
jgi:DnaK suppressor protein